MSTVRELIAQMEREDEQRRELYKQHFDDQEKRYEEIKSKFDVCSDKSKKHIENIVKNLEQLTSNKHSIEKALRETENLTGLPIPYEQHGSVIDLMSNITKFMNDPNIINRPNTLLLSEIQNDTITVAEDVANDLKKSTTEFVQAEALYHGVKSLISLNKANEPKNLDDLFNTIPEE